MSLTFITGNKNKYEEARTMIPSLVQRDLELVEIQSTDAHEIIKAKLAEAQKQHSGALVVEDTALHLEALGGLPGPFIKWFLKAMKPAGIYDAAARLGNDRAYAVTLLGYSDGKDTRFFEGRIYGRIVAPVGERGFGWDFIFMPDGYTRSFAQMSAEEKNAISMRKAAFGKLEEFLKTSKV